MAMINARDVLLVSWTPLKLLRPRNFQVTRAAKALRLSGWRPHLIGSDFHNSTDVFDSEVETRHRASFVSVKQIIDPAYMDGRKRDHPWTEQATSAVNRWVRWRWSPIIFSFGQPWSSHIAVLAAAKAKRRLKWVAHFSDPWTDSPYLTVREGAEHDLARRQEREIVERADVLVFVTKETADLMMGKYQPELQRKVRVIPHLLDLEIAPALLAPESATHPTLRLLHTGSLYNTKRAPAGLFEALRHARQRAGSKLPLRVDFLGWVADAPMQVLCTGLEDIVSWQPPLPYMMCLREMANADVLVVIDADFEASPFLPSKIFDYLLFEKPMFGLTPPGSATWRFLQDLGYPCVGPNDVEGIEAVLKRFLKDQQSGQLRATPAHLEARRKYDLRVAGKEYVEIADNLQKREQ